jgi:signal peptidase I
MAAAPCGKTVLARFPPPSFESMIGGVGGRSAGARRRGRRARNRRRRALLGLRWLLVALAAAVMWPTSLGGTISYLAVGGDSMLPSLHPGDLVVTRAQGGYRVGDVIVYVVPRGDVAQGRRVVHRIVGGDAVTGFTMRGDNNSFVDPWKPRADRVLGRVVLDVPLAGGWMMQLLRPINLGILCGALTVTALLWPRAAKPVGRGTRASGAHVRSSGRARGPDRARRPPGEQPLCVMVPGPSAEDAGFEPARVFSPTRFPIVRPRPLGESSASESSVSQHASGSSACGVGDR